LIQPQLNAVYSSAGMWRRYEVWFVRCGLADGSGAWWFRYLLINNLKFPAEMPPRRHFQVWATYFPRDSMPQSFIVDLPLEQLEVSHRNQIPFHCRATESGIEEGRCWGNLQVKGHTISWKLRIGSNFGTKLSDKGWIGFSRSPHSDATFSGEIVFDGKRWNAAPLGFGVQGHNCGYRHRTYWRWMHAYFPNPQGGSTLEALVYDLPLGMVFRNAVLWHHGKSTSVRAIREQEILRTQGRLRWVFSGKLHNDSLIEATIEGSAPGVHELPYTRTDGSGTFPVSNASLALAVVKLQNGETLSTEGGAVLEMGGEELG
jgi:hypothetical protein